MEKIAKNLQLVLMSIILISTVIAVGIEIKNIFEAKDSTVYALTDTSVYFYQNKEWKLHSHSEILKNISSFSILDNSNIWGCGQYGLIVNFQNNKFRCFLKKKAI